MTHGPQNIWCVGRNYLGHVKEMHSPIPKNPLFFLKSGSCLNPHSTIQLPGWSTEIHHEIELAFLIDENLNFSHITLALDLTARDMQTAAKKMGEPWTLAKSFRGACPIGLWISILDIKDLMTLKFFLKKNNYMSISGVSPKQLLKLKCYIFFSVVDRYKMHHLKSG